MTFRNDFGKVIFDQKYRNEVGGCGNWSDLASNHFKENISVLENTCKGGICGL